MLSASAYNDRLKTFNILVKAKNFLVFQGDVEAIASQSPKELSRLVDQVSGSLEYKDAYEAAKVAQDRALENQKYTLFKRKGMSTELSFFKGQKSEAERFKKLQTERDAHVLHQVLWKLFHLDKRIRTNTKVVETSNAQLPVLKKELNEAEKTVKRARREQAKAATEMQNQRNAIRAREKELERAQPELDAVEEKIKFAQQKMANAEHLCKSLEPDIAKLKAGIAKAEKDHASVKKAADLAAQEKASAGLSLSNDDLARYHELKAEANVRATAERQKLETLSRDIKMRRGTLQSLQDKLSDAQKQRDKLDAEVQVLSDRKESLEEKRRTAQQSLTNLRAAVEEAEKKKAAIRSREETVNTTLQGCLKKISEAGVLQREHEREAKMKEMVASLQRNVAGVHGRLADLCKPTQRKYDVAIATILGRNADAIVVETQRDAIECIELLKRQRTGQATFIPLDTAQVKEINDRLRSIASGARLAFDVIQFDTKVERAMQYACGNAIVCDSMAIARNICYDKRQDVKAVTLEGTVIHKSGLISGGQSGEVGTQRWEEHAVEGLRREREACMAELRELGKQRHATDRLDGTLIEVRRLEADLASLDDDLSSVDKRLTGASAERDVLDTQITNLAPRVDAAQTELDGILTQTTALQTTVDTADDAVFAAFCRQIGVRNIREYEAGQLKLMQQQSDARMEYEAQKKRLEATIQFDKKQLADVEARLNYNQQTIVRRSERLAELRNERKRLRAALESTVKDIDGMKEALVGMQADEETANGELREAKEVAERAQSALDQQAKESAALLLDLELLATERLKLYRKCRLEEIVLPLLTGSKELRKVPLEEQVSLTSPEQDSLATDYSMDLDESASRTIAVQDYGIKVDFDDLDRAEKQDGGDEMRRELGGRIEAAVSELERMTPNIRASDRLNDTEQRLAEVDGEFDRARRETKKAQDEYMRLKKIRCDLFNKAFDHISSKIDSVYKELTKSKASPKGGSAYLIVENGEEPYLAGLQFSAIPPAKTFRGIDHLSGGEKTMAAVALLFAVQSVFPAPFIVLDEVDAALDSVNVQRVADYIRSRASKELQFIVISHKASLYERSSALVGVMRDQEVNSSATLTLDLEQYA